MTCRFASTPPSGVLLISVLVALLKASSSASPRSFSPCPVVRSLRGRAAQPRPAARRAQRDHRRGQRCERHRGNATPWPRMTGGHRRGMSPANNGRRFQRRADQEAHRCPATATKFFDSNVEYASAVSAGDDASTKTDGWKAMALTAMDGASPIWRAAATKAAAAPLLRRDLETMASRSAACPVDYVVAPLLARSTLIGNARWAQAWPRWSDRAAGGRRLGSAGSPARPIV